MNASSAKINNLTLSLKASMRRALASKAFTIVLALGGFILLCYAFSFIAQACIYIFGETLGLLVYFVICFALIYAAEAYDKRTRARRF